MINPGMQPYIFLHRHMDEAIFRFHYLKRLTPQARTQEPHQRWLLQLHGHLEGIYSAPTSHSLCLQRLAEQVDTGVLFVAWVIAHQTMDATFLEQINAYFDPQCEEHRQARDWAGQIGSSHINTLSFP